MEQAFDELSVALQEHYRDLQDDLYDGLLDEVVERSRQALEWGQSPSSVLAHGLVAGMDFVGQDFRAGTLFVPEILRAARAMKAAMELLRPLLAGTGAARLGVAVIGTVRGDIHDIGKNLVAMMLEGAGLEVINLGFNVDASKFVAAVREHRPDILGLSALLTTSMPDMVKVMDRLRDEDLRAQVRVLVGGAPLSAAFAEQIGADAYCRDAAEAVDTARGLVRREVG